jgi:hypothetical protein
MGRIIPSKDNGMLSDKDVEVFVLRYSTRWLWWARSLMPRAASLSAVSGSDINFYVKLTGLTGKRNFVTRALNLPASALTTPRVGLSRRRGVSRPLADTH